MKKLFCGVLATLCLVLSACSNSSDTNRTYKEVVVDGARRYVTGNYKTCYELDSLAVESSLGESAFVVCSMLKNEPMYSFYYQEATGEHKLGSIPAEDTVVLYTEEDEAPPHIEMIDSIGEICGGNTVEFIPESKMCHKLGIEKYRMYVPEDGIVWDTNNSQPQKE
ncbi:hypothetical protein IKG16_02400 [Candidatus Saccharibacteria bacterium]|nr:hypothetical protein [Candidatus Saccharibacteria bacterium]